MYERNGKLIQSVFRKYFLPTIMMTMALSMGIIVDSIIVGNTLGSDAMAAVNLVLPITLCFSTIYVMLGIGGSVLASIAKGSRENQLANVIFTLSLTIMLLISILILVSGFAYLEEVVQLLAGKSGFEALVKEYLGMLIYGAPLLIVIPGIIYFVRADGRPNLASLVLIVANVVNLCMDLVYILGFNMGIKGAAMATVTGYGVGFLILLRYFLAKGRSFCFTPVKRKELKTVGKIIVCGIPSAMGSSLLFAKTLSINSIVLIRLGPSGMVAFSVCLSCLSFVSMFIAGTAQTMMPIVATLYGEKDYKGVHFTINRALKVVMLSAILLVIVFELFPNPILYLFGVREAGEISVARQAIRIFAFSLIGTGFSFLMMFYFQTIQRSVIATVITIVQGFVVVVPAAFILSAWWGSSGIWLAFILAEVCTLFIIILVTKVIVKHSKGSLEGLFLLNRSTDDDLLLDVTVENKEGDAAGLSEKVVQFCLDHNIKEKTANHVGLAVEEMVVNTIQHGYVKNQKYYIDVIIRIKVEEVIIAIRDNGIPFNPTLYHEKEESVYTCSGILLVKGLAKSVNYTRLIGLNSTIISMASH